MNSRISNFINWKIKKKMTWSPHFSLNVDGTGGNTFGYINVNAAEKGNQLLKWISSNEHNRKKDFSVFRSKILSRFLLMITNGSGKGHNTTWLLYFELQHFLQVRGYLPISMLTMMSKKKKKKDNNNPNKQTCSFSYPNRINYSFSNIHMLSNYSLLSRSYVKKQTNKQVLHITFCSSYLI